MAAVVWEIRMPRIISSFLVGACLGISGVSFQGILKNPLADPYTLGISTGACFGASLALLLNIVMGFYVPVTIMALCFGILTLIIVILIAHKGSGLESSNLIIAGIIVSAILQSGVSFIKMLAGENVSAIIFWIMGSFSAAAWKDVYLVLPVFAVGFCVMYFFSPTLDIMSLGDKNAKALGVNVSQIRLIYLITASILTAVSVSVCGVIGFVGLIVPHLLRMWVSVENKVLIPLCGLLGGLLLMTADNAARLISSGEIPVGVITTLIGGPFFIYVFTKRQGAYYDK